MEVNDVNGDGGEKTKYMGADKISPGSEISRTR